MSGHPALHAEVIVKCPRPSAARRCAEVVGQSAIHDSRFWVWSFLNLDLGIDPGADVSGLDCRHAYADVQPEGVHHGVMPFQLTERWPGWQLQWMTALG